MNRENVKTLVISRASQNLRVMNKKIVPPATYEAIDRQCFDYDLINAAEGFSYRGPIEIDCGAPVIVLGAASTFGRFVEHPFPKLVTEKYGIPAVNFGFAGPGPKVFERFEDIINRHPCVVVTFLSGRSISTSFLTGDTQRKCVMLDDLRIQTQNARKAFARVNGFELEGDGLIPVGSYLPAQIAWNTILRNYSRDRVEELITETRKAYISSMRKLLRMITGKKILLWFSERPADYELNFDSVKGIFGKFPQFVDQSIVDSLIPEADGFVECVTSRGMPFKLSQPRDGASFPHNVPNGIVKNYPSQEMHDDVADVLGPYLKDCCSEVVATVPPVSAS